MTAAADKAPAAKKAVAKKTAAKKAAPAPDAPPAEKPTATSKGKKIGRGVGTVWVKSEDGSNPDGVAFAEGDSVPDWAAKQMGDHCFVDHDDA